MAVGLCLVRMRGSTEDWWRTTRRGAASYVGGNKAYNAEGAEKTAKSGSLLLSSIVKSAKICSARPASWVNSAK